jgi:hypothetical protein
MLHFLVSTAFGAVAELRITALRVDGFGWKRVATGVGFGTIYQFAGEDSKILARPHHRKRNLIFRLRLLYGMSSQPTTRHTLWPNPPDRRRLQQYPRRASAQPRE